MQVQICPHCGAENEIMVCETEKTWQYVSYIEAETHTYEYSSGTLDNKITDVSFGCRKCGKAVDMDEIITKEVADHDDCPYPPGHEFDGLGD